MRLRGRFASTVTAAAFWCIAIGASGGANAYTVTVPANSPMWTTSGRARVVPPASGATAAAQCASFGTLVLDGPGARAELLFHGTTILLFVANATKHGRVWLDGRSVYMGAYPPAFCSELGSYGGLDEDAAHNLTVVLPDNGDDQDVTFEIQKAIVSVPDGEDVRLSSDSNSTVTVHQPDPSSHPRSGPSRSVIIGAAVGAIALAATFTAVIFLLIRHRRRRRVGQDSQSDSNSSMSIRRPRAFLLMPDEPHPHTRKRLPASTRAPAPDAPSTRDQDRERDLDAENAQLRAALVDLLEHVRTLRLEQPTLPAYAERENEVEGEGEKIVI